MADPAPFLDGADTFLALQTKRAGKIKGESQSVGHVDDIVLVGWNWGAQQSSALGSTQVTARRSYSALTVVKRVDQATTGILSALATNDEVKEAKLSLRRAGGTQQDFFSVTVRNGRVIGVAHAGDERGATLETVTISFQKVEVEYRQQLKSGIAGGAAIFTDELPTA